MGTSEEKRWELVQQRLLAESRGEAAVAVRSTRTLFGIKSHVEGVIERVSEEESARCIQKAQESPIPIRDHTVIPARTRSSQ